jgi:hypothetical protein
MFPVQYWLIAAAAMACLCAVLLGFVVIAVWEQIGAARGTTFLEADELAGRLLAVAPAAARPGQAG